MSVDEVLFRAYATLKVMFAGAVTDEQSKMGDINSLTTSVLIALLLYLMQAEPVTAVSVVLKNELGLPFTFQF